MAVDWSVCHLCYCYSLAVGSVIHWLQ